MPINNLLLVGMLILSLAVQAIGAKTMFVMPQGMPPAMRFVAACFVAGGVIHVWVLSQVVLSWPGTLVGMCLYACSLLLFAATCRANRQRRLSVAYSEDTPNHVVWWGPYRYVRHPFYASYCMTWLAGPAACGSGWLLAMFLLMLGLYVRAARFEEGKFRQSSQAGAYEVYRRATPMMIPFLRVR